MNFRIGRTNIVACGFSNRHTLKLGKATILAFIFALVFFLIAPIILLTPRTAQAMQTQDFSRGVLAINSDQSVYQLGDTASLQMAALDEHGHTLCQADLKLTVTEPSGSQIIFTTQEKSITHSASCGDDNVTDAPDYLSSFVPRETGMYHLRLANIDTGLSIDNNFEVRTSLPYKIERTAATRINPFKADYQMNIKVTADKDYIDSI